MTTTEPSKNFSHWSDYWSTGALTSLPQDFVFNYDGEVAEFWQRQFGELSPGAQVLDICTGNAPIALIGGRVVCRPDCRPEDYCHRRRPTGPRADWPAAAAGRRIAGNYRIEGAITEVESLPFDDQWFDLITSQYGLEYCNMEQAGPELARVLKPGGCLAVLAHAADTAIVETMAAESSDYASLRDSGLFKVLRSWESGQLADPDLPRRLEPLLRRLASQAQRAGASPLLGQVVQFHGRVDSAFPPRSAASSRKCRRRLPPPARSRPGPS